MSLPDPLGLAVLGWIVFVFLGLLTLGAMEGRAVLENTVPANTLPVTQDHLDGVQRILQRKAAAKAAAEVLRNANKALLVELEAHMGQLIGWYSPERAALPTPPGRPADARRHRHEPPQTPRHVFLYLWKSRHHMNNPVLRWNASPSSNVNLYAISWSVNGGAPVAVTVPRTAAGDSAGYSADFAAAAPGVTLNPGDKVVATISAVDAVNNLTSTPVVASPVTIPTPPPPPPTAPLPPVNVTLGL